MNTDTRHMKLALRLARRGVGRTEPNPAVGCVIVKHGSVIGSGYHPQSGGPHAEAQALADARRRGHDPRGATVYVTLEPCAHHGKTPPCVDALVAARVGRVVCALRDPAPHVDGKGIEQLRAAGIAVEVGVMAKQARALVAPFIKRVTTGRPYVTLKWAQTLDGRIATRTGDSQWITGPAARRVVHRQRAVSDAVMVGIGTALKDDPQLNVRGLPVPRQPAAVVIDPRLELPPRSKLAAAARDRPVIVMTGAGKDESDGAAALRDAGVEVVALPATPDGSLDVDAGLAWLVDQYEATNVLVEGGRGLVSRLIARGLADRALVFIAPRLLGDADGLGPLESGSREAMDTATRWTLSRVRRFPNGDVLMDYQCRG